MFYRRNFPTVGANPLSSRVVTNIPVSAFRFTTVFHAGPCVKPAVSVAVPFLTSGSATAPALDTGLDFIVQVLRHPGLFSDNDGLVNLSISFVREFVVRDFFVQVCFCRLVCRFLDYGTKVNIVGRGLNHICREIDRVLSRGFLRAVTRAFADRSIVAIFLLLVVLQFLKIFLATIYHFYYKKAKNFVKIYSQSVKFSFSVVFLASNGPSFCNYSVY